MAAESLIDAAPALLRIHWVDFCDLAIACDRDTFVLVQKYCLGRRHIAPETPLPMKFLLIDDHTLIREALRGVLKELDEGATILEASRWSDAARLLAEHSDIALVLLDLGLPDRDGFAALEEARARHPKIPIVILSGTCDRDYVVKALDLGAVGFIPKSGEREVMLGALRLVFSGGVYIPPEILSRPEAPHGPGPQTNSGRRSEGPAPPLPADLGLTARQVDVLALMMR